MNTAAATATMATPSSSSLDPLRDKPLLQEVLPKLRPFQREALEFATEGKVSDRQWHNEAGDGGAAPVIASAASTSTTTSTTNPNKYLTKKPSRNATSATTMSNTANHNQFHHPHGRLLLADEMGLGKTVTALAIASYYQAEWPLLILCPASLRYTWPAEIEKFFPSLPPQAVHVVAGFSDVAFLKQLLHQQQPQTTTTTTTTKTTPIQVVVCTYSLFQNRSAVAQSLQSAEHPFRVVICDESHNLKEKNSQRAKLILPLLERSKRLLMLSGTPALARPVELWSQVFPLQPDLFGLHSHYIQQYCNPTKKRIGRGRFIMDYGGSSNEAELHSKLRQVMVRRLKADVLSELPPKQRSVVPVTITPTEKEACQEAMKLLLQDSSPSSRGGSAGGSPAAVQEALERRQNSQYGGGNNSSNNGNASFHSSIMQAYQATGMGKAQAVVDYVLDFLAGSENQKILVFCHHKKVMDHIDAALCRYKSPNHKNKNDKNSPPHMRIDGSVPPVVRSQLVRQFQTNSRVRVGLLSMTAAGVGLTLTAASTVVFAELHWTPGVLAQAEDRAHRIGSTASSIQIVYMVCRDEKLSLDSMLWRMLGKKIGTLGQIVDGVKEQPYLHAAKENNQQKVGGVGTGTAAVAGRSVQEEVSDFFASSTSTEQSKNNNNKKTPVKGSIESFFKARSTITKPTTPSSLQNQITPLQTPGTAAENGGTLLSCAEVSSSELCSVCSNENAECLCRKLFEPSSSAPPNQQRHRPTPVSVEKETAKSRKAAASTKSIEWPCQSCTFINCKTVNARAYYTCEMCHEVYTPTNMMMSTNNSKLLSRTPHYQQQNCALVRSQFAAADNGPATIVIEEGCQKQKTKGPRGVSNKTPEIIEIEEETPRNGLLLSKVEASEACSGKTVESSRNHLLEFRVSANTGRVSIFYVSTKTEESSANVNFDMNEIVTSQTSDELLKMSTTRGVGRNNKRLEASDIAFNDDNVSKIVGQLKDVKSPGTKIRYGKDLKEFVSSYLVLREAEKKSIRDAGILLPPGKNLGHVVLQQSLTSKGKCIDRYTGGAKERARENHAEGTASANDQAVLCGNACVWCGLVLSQAQRRASATYCTQKCAEEGRLKRGGQFASSNLRSAMFAIEGGVCTICNVAAHELFKQIKALQPAERLNKLLNVGWKLPSSGKAMENLLNEPKEGDFWQVDHISAVAEGGGGCGIENLRTLCVPCHQHETEKLRTRLKLASPIKQANDSDDPSKGSSVKKRKQLDIRESFFSFSNKRKPTG